MCTQRCHIRFPIFPKIRDGEVLCSYQLLRLVRDILEQGWGVQYKVGQVWLGPRV